MRRQCLILEEEILQEGLFKLFVGAGGTGHQGTCWAVRWVVFRYKVQPLVRSVHESCLTLLS